MTDDSLSKIFGALADPTRRSILATLADGETVVGDLAAPHNMSAPAISRHLKVLESAGLIERRIDAQWRRCRLSPEGFQAASNWITFYRNFWDQKLDKLDTFLEKTTKAGTAQHRADGPAALKQEQEDDGNTG